jgi:hypothetical protein
VPLQVVLPLLRDWKLRGAPSRSAPMTADIPALTSALIASVFYECEANDPGILLQAASFRAFRETAPF